MIQRGEQGRVGEEGEGLGENKESVWLERGALLSSVGLSTT